MAFPCEKTFLKVIVKKTEKKAEQTNQNMNLQLDLPSLCLRRCAAARRARFKLPLCRRDNPSALRPCPANARRYSSSSPSSQQDGGAERQRKWMMEDKEAGVPLSLFLRRLSACAHTTQPLARAAGEMRNHLQLSRYDGAAALFPRESNSSDPPPLRQRRQAQLA